MIIPKIPPKFSPAARNGYETRGVKGGREGGKGDGLSNRGLHDKLDQIFLRLSCEQGIFCHNPYFFEIFFNFLNKFYLFSWSTNNAENAFSGVHNKQNPNT